MGISIAWLQPGLEIARYAVLGLTYLGLGLGYAPGLRMNRATIALVGAAALIGLGALSLQEAWRAIDPNTIGFLLGMMVVNANLSYAGFFERSLALLLQLTRSPFGILVALTVGTGVLSAVFLNDTLALVFTPLTLTLTQTLKLKPIPYLLAMAAATNIGSVATLSGNPQNILVGAFSGISYLDFARALTPIALIGLVLQIGLLWLLYPEVRSLQPCVKEASIRYRTIPPLLVKSGLIAGGLLVALVCGAPLGESALIAAALLLVTRRIKAERVLRQVDWSLLVMFSGLFVLTRATQSLNLLAGFTGWLSSAAGLLGVTAILSNLISNVPAVLVLQPLIPPDDTRAWLLLATASTVAGNLTLLGSVANLIVVEAAAAQGYKLSFGEHLRFGLPLTGATLAIAYWWIR